MQEPVCSLPIFDKEKCTLFALGRNAMYAACTALDLKPQDEVLTPAFDCDGALQPFKVLGLKMRFFRSDPYTFSADIGDIRKRINTRTRLIHVVNHFGMPQPWDNLLVLRKETGIPILEDNAYSLFSRFGERQFGSLADISVFSLRKNLNLIDGGLLRVNNPEITFRMPEKDIPWIFPAEKSALIYLAKSSLGYYKLPASLRRFARRFNHAVEPLPPLFSDAKADFPDCHSRDEIGKEFSCDYIRPMSRLARIQLGKISIKDIEEICAQKNKFYSKLSEALSSRRGIKVLWPKLTEGIVPFCLSFLVDEKRDMIFDYLRKKYDVMVWPTLSRLVLDQLENYPEVELLGRKLLQINLPSGNVRTGGFCKYLDNLIDDLDILIKS